jgi:hypothetical protein
MLSEEEGLRSRARKYQSPRQDAQLAALYCALHCYRDLCLIQYAENRKSTFLGAIIYQSIMSLRKPKDIATSYSVEQTRQMFSSKFPLSTAGSSWIEFSENDSASKSTSQEIKWSDFCPR